MPSINVNSLKLDDCVMVNKGHLYFKRESREGESELFGFGGGDAFIFYFRTCFCFAGSLE